MMKRSESARELDANTRRFLEEKREARKQKLAMRICKNSGTTRSVASIEAITGTLRSKKPAIAPPAAAAMPAKQPTVAKKEIVPIAKPEVNKQQKKPFIGFRQTATSMKRAEMAQAGVKPKAQVAKPAVATAAAPIEAKKPSVAHTRAIGLLKKKLTVPQSPNFTVRRQTIARQPLPNPSTSASNTTVVDGSPSRRSSITWTVPFTPEARRQESSPLRTPKVKNFTRKSFSETKSPARKVPAVPVQLIRSSSSASLARLSRPSVAFASSINASRFSRSFFDLPKELSEKEKLQQWLEKKGRSGCRHLGCLGPQQLKEYEALSNDTSSSARKSIKVTKPHNANQHNHHHHEESANPASPHLKRKSTASVLNATFEHEHDDEEQSEAAAAIQSSPNVNNEMMNESIGAACAMNEIEEEDKFQTPGPSSSPADVALDVNALKEGRVDELLETILALVQAPVYEESKIEHWINKSAETFPAVKTHALYWELKARIQERRGNTMEALDIYSAAVSSKVEPIDMMQKLFDDFLLRVGTDMPVGEGTPLLRSLGVGTPMIRNQRKRQQRRPLIDADQAFKSTTVKFELKLQAAFQSTTKMNKKENMTPFKLAAGPSNNRLSVVGQGADNAYKLLATPVRRSTRPKSPRLVFGTPLPTQHEGRTFVVDNLDDLSPQMKAKVDLRQNIALGNLD